VGSSNSGASLSPLAGVLLPGKIGAVTPLSWDDTPAPAPLRPAPDRTTTALPAGFGLTADPGTTTFGDGAVVMGGSPLRLLRLSARARSLTRRWNAGGRVGDGRGAQLLARRLVSSGAYNPHPGTAGFTAGDVTVVIPVRDRPDQLEALLTSLGGLSCVVVDDGSRDSGRTKDIAARAGATCICLPTNHGPAAARNAGLDAAASPLVAFVDSDCRPPQDWLPQLIGHFDDPLVAAVAPRIVPAAVAPATLVSRYEAVRSSLDRGGTDGLVRAQSRIPYVPSATLIVRRAVTAQPFFDPALRGGEDVDLVWRLTDAGWDVRYVASCAVVHRGPESLRAWMGRRYFYGTSAGPLALRHPGALAPLQTSVWTAAVWGLALARRPRAAALALAASIGVLAHRLRRLVDAPVRMATRIAGGGTAKSALPALGGLARAWSPALALGLCHPRTRRAAAVALLAPAFGDWMKEPGGLDPVRYSALHVTDDIAYGTGIWVGCVRARTIRPLLPRVVLRARVWSAPSLQETLGRRDGAVAET